jgi:hypothetical protein
LAWVPVITVTPSGLASRCGRMVINCRDSDKCGAAGDAAEGHQALVA